MSDQYHVRLVGGQNLTKMRPLFAANDKLFIAYDNSIIGFSTRNDNFRETESRGWFCALLSASGIQYILSIVGIVFLFINFTQGGVMSNCGLPKFFISINLILCFIVSVLSVLPRVQESLPNSGLLQSAVVTLYTVYLTWSAVANNPYHECNPGLLDTDANKENKVTFDTSSIVGLVVWILCILYSSLRSASRVAEIPDVEKQGLLS